MLAFGEYEIDETASTIKARDWKDATDLVISSPPELAATLRAEGFDASEDGTGRTTLIPQIVGAICADSFSGGAGGRPEGASVGHFIPVSYAIQERAVAEKPTTGPQGKGFHEELAYTIEARRPQSVAIAFSSNDSSSDAQIDIAPTLRAMNDANSKPNGGGQMAVAYDLGGREGGAAFEGPHSTANLRSSSGGSSRSYVLQDGLRLAVRRLTPVECERLQGFPDNFTAIPWGAKRKISPEMREYMVSVHGLSVDNGRTDLAADAPRYKSLGNSWARNCGRWIIERIYLEMKGELK